MTNVTTFGVKIGYHDAMGSGHRLQEAMTIAGMEVMLRVDALGADAVYTEASSRLYTEQPDVFRELFAFAEIVYHPDDKPARQRFLDTEMHRYATLHALSDLTRPRTDA